MITLEIIDSILKQYEESTSVFSRISETPEPIKTIKAILSKQDYIGFKGHRGKLLQPVDLWQLVSAWDINEELFAAYTFQGNRALTRALQIFKSLKNNGKLTQANMNLFYDDNKYRFLETCIASCDQDDESLNFIIKHIDQHQHWHDILKLLNNKNLVSTKHLQKIEHHIEEIHSCSLKLNALNERRDSNLTLVLKLIIKNPQSAALYVQYYADIKHKNNHSNLLELIETHNIADETALNHLKDYYVINFLCPDDYINRVDKEVLSFIMGHLKDYTKWKEAIKFLKSKNLLNISNLNKIAENPELISAAVLDKDLPINYDNQPQLIFNLMASNPKHATPIFNYFCDKNICTDDVEIAIKLINKCKNINENALSALTTEAVSFIAKLPEDIQVFIMLHINEFNLWANVLSYLKVSLILTLENLQAAEKDLKIISKAVHNHKSNKAPQEIYDLLINKPEHSSMLMRYFSNISQDYHEFSLGLIKKYQVFDQESLDFLSGTNLTILKTAPNDVVDFMMLHIKDHSQWSIIMDFLSHAKILTAENLEKAERSIVKLSLALSGRTSQMELTLNDAQQFLDLLIKNNGKINNIVNYFMTLNYKGIFQTLDLIEKYSVFEEEHLKYLYDDNLRIIQNQTEEVRNFIMTRIKTYAKWDKVVVYLAKMNILTLENLQKTENNLDRLSNLVTQNDTQEVPIETAQHVFNFIIDNPQHAVKIFENPNNYNAIAFLINLKPGYQEQVLQNTQFANSAHGVITLLTQANIIEDDDLEFIFNNFQTTPFLYRCLNILNESGLSIYFPNIMDLKQDPLQLNILAKALSLASVDNKISGGLDTFEVIMQYPTQFANLLTLLASKNLATPENLNLAILNLEHIEAVQAALASIPNTLLSQEYYENVMSSPQYAENIVKGIMVLGEKPSSADQRLITQNPINAVSIARALAIINHDASDKIKYGDLITQYPEHCDKLIQGLNLVGNVEEAIACLKAHPEHADKLGQAFVILVRFDKPAQELIAINLMTDYPAHALNIAKAMVALNEKDAPNPEVMSFLKEYAQYSGDIENAIMTIKKRPADNNYDYLALLMLSFDTEHKCLSEHPLYQRFINNNNSKIPTQTVITELAQLNCDFAHLLLAKIYLSYEMDLTQLTKARIFYNKIKHGSAWYFNAQRGLFDVLLACCQIFESTGDQQFLAEYKKELDQVVNNLRANQQEGDALAVIDRNINTGEYDSNFIKPRICSTISSAYHTCIATQTGESNTPLWRKYIAPPPVVVADVSSSSTSSLELKGT